ncbi:MurR/RpiR family transcriptional regulator [Lactiplantibacillus plantarum]
MFSYDQVQQLNRLEIEIYKYIVGHPAEVSTMTIRQLADHSHVSATTILRFLKHMGYDGYAEFKFTLKEQLRQDATQPLAQTVVPMRTFFDRMNLPDITAKLHRVAELVHQARMVVLIGSGTSAGLAAYGSHLFANFGLYSLMISDTSQPIRFSNRIYRIPSFSHFQYLESLKILLNKAFIIGRVARRWSLLPLAVIRR